jgi:hypothetical protein
MYLSLQQFSLENPRPYDDTGWTFQLMRNIELKEIKDPAVLEEYMTLLTAPAHAPGGISGGGSIVVVPHNTDNNLMSFRYSLADVTMHAAEAEFEMDDRTFPAGSFIIPAAIGPAFKRASANSGSPGTAPMTCPTCSCTNSTFRGSRTCIRGVEPRMKAG